MNNKCKQHVAPFNFYWIDSFFVIVEIHRDKTNSNSKTGSKNLAPIDILIVHFIFSAHHFYSYNASVYSTLSKCTELLANNELVLILY